MKANLIQESKLHLMIEKDGVIIDVIFTQLETEQLRKVVKQ